MISCINSPCAHINDIVVKAHQRANSGLENIVILSKISKISKISDFFDIFDIFDIYQAFAHTRF